MRVALTALVATLALALALAVMLGCRANGTAITGDDAGAPIDTDVMAFLSAARALHHQANVKEDAGDVAGAIESMQKLVGLPQPHAGTPAAEIEEVLADAYARLAELRVKNKELDLAARDVESGLAHAKEPTYFRGHLIEVEGVVEEERAKMLDAAGKKEEAKAARAHAIQLFDEVVGIQMKVIDKLGDGGGK
jgi:hypothetical protein